MVVTPMNAHFVSQDNPLTHANALGVAALRDARYDTVLEAADIHSDEDMDSK